MQIGVSKEEIEVHIRSEKHRFNVPSQKISIHSTKSASVGTKIDANFSAESERVPNMEATIHGILPPANDQTTEQIKGINVNDMHDNQNELAKQIGNG